MALLLLQRSPYGFPIPALLIGFEGWNRDASIRIVLKRLTGFSMTRNLLFGNLQLEFVDNSWVPVQVFAGDGLNSLPGVQLHQGVDNRVPNRLSMSRLDSGFSHLHDFYPSMPVFNCSCH